MSKYPQEIQIMYQDYPEIPYISPDRPLEDWLSQVKIGTASLVSKRNMTRTAEGLLPGDINLLWRISLGTYTSDSWTPKYFEYDYGIDCSASLKMLLAEAYARELSAAQSLDHIAAPILKALLKSKGVKGLSKMNKASLKEAILGHYSEEELDQAIPLRSYELTDKGVSALANNQDVVDRHPKKKL